MHQVSSQMFVDVETFVGHPAGTVTAALEGTQDASSCLSPPLLRDTPVAKNGAVGGGRGLWA